MIMWRDYARFTVPGDPVPKARARAHQKAQGICHYTPKTTKQFEKAVRTMAMQFSRAKPEKRTPIRLHLIAVFTRPKYMMGSKYDDGLIEHVVRPDLDNVLKAVKDSLNGLLYDDDGQVCQIRCEAYWAEKTPNKSRSEVMLFCPSEAR